MKKTELDLNGIPVHITRKPIKNMYLRVYPPDGRVEVTAPFLTPDSAIETFVRERSGWVAKRRAAACSVPVETGYRDGGVLPVWGVPRRLSIRLSPERKQLRVSQETGGLTVHGPVDADKEAIAAAIDRWYGRALSDKLNELVPPREALMGVHASGWRIRNMTSRWGTCNTKTGCITVNLQLAKRKPAYLDYLITHELTHLLEPSHNARFYALMDSFHPGWKQMRKLLRTTPPL